AHAPAHSARRSEAHRIRRHMRSTDRKASVRSARLEASLLRAECVQCGSEQNATECRIKICEDVRDGARPTQLSPASHTVGPRDCSSHPISRGILMKSYLLWVGSLCTPLLVSAFLIEGFTRPQYNWMRHPISSLSFGPLGWPQIVSF